MTSNICSGRVSGSLRGRGITALLLSVVFALRAVKRGEEWYARQSRGRRPSVAGVPRCLRAGGVLGCRLRQAGRGAGPDLQGLRRRRHTGRGPSGRGRRPSGLRRRHRLAGADNGHHRRPGPDPPRDHGGASGLPPDAGGRGQRRAVAGPGSRDRQGRVAVSGHRGRAGGPGQGGRPGGAAPARPRPTPPVHGRHRAARPPARRAAVAALDRRGGHGGPGRPVTSGGGGAHRQPPGGRDRPHPQQPPGGRDQTSPEPPMPPTPWSRCSPGPARERRAGRHEHRLGPHRSGRRRRGCRPHHRRGTGPDLGWPAGWPSAASSRP